MNASLVIDGKSMSVTTKEARSMLTALHECRVAGKGAKSYERTKERDMLIYDLHCDGHTDASIGRLVGRTARSVRAAIGRVEAGRYRNGSA